ncbi:hypothetical protein O6072_18460 [Mycolicibacterium neoaurum]|uniref:hypothetical protein n=1 Tax=Mycolicibacterium neoaurum TaxID=1795 RepID=UPI00248C0C9D|nr:hypothetical protein [Mycolicibacterium neoaurum]WBP93195.1 hypothetical protein O7W24_18785 [Mycolicibacterium neoaurum]WBS06838.1 hypothetical protein O6072_18460 [Mycolicibacterium neoaurum]
MSAILITYDLNKPGQDYDRLYEKIKGLGDWWHYLDSTWIVITYISIADVRDQLLQVMDSSDNLLILNISGDAYDGWLSKDAWDWLKSHV